MSLLTIAQNVANEIGLPAPLSVMGSADGVSIRLLSAIRRATEQIAKRGRWENFYVSYTFDTVSGTDLYDLPAGLDHIVPDTIWDRTNHWQLRGPLSESEWQAYKSALIASPALRLRCRLVGGQIQIDPVPSSVDTIAFEYLSQYYVKDSSGTRKSAFTQDSDVTVLPEWLVELGAIWRYKRARGLPYADERNDCEMAIDREYAKNRARPRINIGRPPAVRLVNIPEGNFTL